MDNTGPVIISACLAGFCVRYSGRVISSEHSITVPENYHQVFWACCPETSGGLGVPRPAAEICGGDGFDVLSGRAAVMTQNGADVSGAFIRGAEITLGLAMKYQVRHAILKANSPSCGSSGIYDGTFSGHIRKGVGVTTALLLDHGIRVWDETTWKWQAVSPAE